MTFCSEDTQSKWPQILKISLEDSSVPLPEVRSSTGDSACNFRGLLLGDRGQRAEVGGEAPLDPGTQSRGRSLRFRPPGHTSDKKSELLNQCCSLGLSGTDLLLLLFLLRGTVPVSKIQKINLPLWAWHTERTLIKSTSIYRLSPNNQQAISLCSFIKKCTFLYFVSPKVRYYSSKADLQIIYGLFSEAMSSFNLQWRKSYNCVMGIAFHFSKLCLC